MVPNPQNHNPARGDAMEVEYRSRKITQTIPVTEGHKDAETLERSQADVCREERLLSKSSSPPASGHQASNTRVSEIESLNQSIQPNSNEASSLEDNRFEAGDSSAAQQNPDQNNITENEPLSPQAERILLEAIRDEVLFRLGVSPHGDSRILIDHYGSRTMRFKLLRTSNEIIELNWMFDRRFEKPDYDAEIEQAFRKAWPRNRDNRWVQQHLVKSDGRSPAIEVPWSSIGKVHQGEINDINHDLVATRTSRGIYYSEYESLWHRWCYAAESEHENSSLSQPRGKIIYCQSQGRLKGDQLFGIDAFACALSYDQPFTKPGDYRYCVGYSVSFFLPKFRGGCNIHSNNFQTAIHWQIRYFRPTKWGSEKSLNYLISKRQTATIQHGLEAVCLEEKRVRISFRVRRTDPGLFSILNLADESLFATTYESERVGATWERYDLKAREGAVPITHYLCEICRVFEKSMEAWDEALDAIDGLVHVDLDDFADQSQVEDLMFDKSFGRSKDYFVALQLLRIADEWLDEIVPGVKQLKKNPALAYRPFCAAEAEENFDAAIRSIDERATVVQNRVRKKVEEINSLRDGLFNATSLRESTKAMALNQAIYVFTVVTVLFTPVSFLATFWALPFLNNPKEGSDTVPEPSAFRRSFIIMPLLTYVLVIGVAWFVGQRNGTNALLGLLRELWEILRQIMRFAWIFTNREVWLVVGRFMKFVFHFLLWMLRGGNRRAPYSSSGSLEA